jgi:hypothetical protein
MVPWMDVRWHPLLETGDEFLDAAPFRFVNTVNLPVPPERVWAALTADDTLVSWSPLVTRLQWTTARPFGVGTSREVTLLWVLTSRERYFRWNQGRRKTFAAVAVSIPGLRRLAEDYVVEPTPAGSRLVWTLAIEPGPTLAPILRLTKPITAWIVACLARSIRSQVV